MTEAIKSYEDWLNDLLKDHYELSQMERKVFIYLIKGYKASWIGEKECLTEQAVRFHIGGIYKKLDLDSNTTNKKSPFNTRALLIYKIPGLLSSQRGSVPFYDYFEHILREGAGNTRLGEESKLPQGKEAIQSG